MRLTVTACKQCVRVSWVFVSLAVSGPQLQDGRHGRRRRRRHWGWRRLPKPPAVVGGAFGERPVCVRPRRGVGHGGVGRQPVVVCCGSRTEEVRRDQAEDRRRQTEESCVRETHLTAVDDGVRRVVCVRIVVIWGGEGAMTKRTRRHTWQTRRGRQDTNSLKNRTNQWLQTKC